MKGSLYSVLCFVFILCFAFAGTVLADTQTDGVNVELNIQGCNNNLVCEPGAGEDENTCPLDCGDGEEEEEPAPPASSGGGIVGADVDLEIENVDVTTTAGTAIVTFDTTKHAISIVQWGTTDEYELGSTATPQSQNSFLFVLPDLKANQTYTFLVVVSNGDERALYEGAFTTQALAQPNVLPSPVTNVSSFTENETPVVEWRNPEQHDYIRIMRRGDTFPLSPFDGEIVYEGQGQRFRDTERSGACGYYTIFARLGGQYSSGVSTTTCDDASFDTDPDQGDTIPLGADDIVFTQQGQPAEKELDRVYLSLSEVTTVHVPNNRDIFEQRVVLVIDNQASGTTMTYVLQYNEQTDRYEAQIDTGTMGAYNEYTAFVLSRGEVIGVFSSALLVQESLSLAQRFFFDIQPFVIIGTVALLVIIWLIFFLIRRRDDDEEENTIVTYR